MISTLAFLLVEGDRIRHRDVDFDIAATRLVLDEVRPMVQLLVLRDRNPHQLTFQADEFVARVVEGSPS